MHYEQRVNDEAMKIKNAFNEIVELIKRILTSVQISFENSLSDVIQHYKRF